MPLSQSRLDLPRHRHMITRLRDRVNFLPIIKFCNQKQFLFDVNIVMLTFTPDQAPTATLDTMKALSHP